MSLRRHRRPRRNGRVLRYRTRARWGWRTVVVWQREWWARASDDALAKLAEAKPTNVTGLRRPK
jgi:hypothetical protein